jgi:putative colanic acid biosynthesis acetyltransferase WcaF
MAEIQDLSHPPVPPSFNGRRKFRVQMWYITWLFLFRLSPHVINGFRVFLLNLFGAKVSTKAKIRPSCFVSYPWNLSVGEYSYLGDRVFIDSLDKVEIGAHVSVSNDVYITAGTHNHQAASFDLILKPVCISSESWLAVRSVIMPGVVIGTGAVVAAAAVVTKSVPALEIWAGNPAKFIKPRR